MIDLPERTVLNELFSQTECGNPAEVEANHIHHTGLIHRFHHGLGVFHIECQWFFAKHMFSGLGCGNSNFSVNLARRCDADRINVVIFN
jgi:hypothetical protein